MARYRKPRTKSRTMRKKRQAREPRGKADARCKAG